MDSLNDPSKNIGLYNMFSISNIGRLAYDNTNVKNVIKLREQYMFESLRHRGLGGYLLFGISSIQDSGNLCWSFNYVDQYYSKDFISRLIIEIVSFIDKIVE